MKNDQAKSVWPWNGKVKNLNLFGIGKTKFKIFLNFIIKLLKFRTKHSDHSKEKINTNYKIINNISKLKVMIDFS